MVDFVMDQTVTGEKPQEDEGKRLLGEYRFRGLTPEVFEALPAEERTKMGSYILRNINYVNRSDVALGLRLIEDGSVEISDLPLLGYLLGKEVSEYDWNAEGRFSKYYGAMENALKNNQDEIDQETRKKLTENILLGIKLSIDKGRLDSGIENLFSLIKNSVKPKDVEILEKLKTIQNSYDMEKADSLVKSRDMTSEDTYYIKYLMKETSMEYPRTADVVYNNILEFGAMVDEEPREIMRNICLSRYEELGDKGKQLIEKLLERNGRFAEQFLSSTAQGFDGLKDIPEIDKLKAIAEKTIIEKDKLVKGDKYSRLFSGDIKMEALVFDPNFSFAKNDWSEGFAVFASNGLIMRETDASKDYFDDEDPKVETQLITRLGNFNKERSFSVDFVPYDRAFFVDAKKHEVMKMGAVGLKKFVEYCNENHIPNNVLLVGDTNGRMGKMIMNFGFVSLDYEQLGELTDDKLDEEEVRVFSTVGRMKEAMKHPFVTRILEKMEKQ